MSRLQEWVRIGRERGASDLLIEAGTPLVIRVRGDLASVGDPLSGELLLQTAKELLSSDEWESFLERRSSDLSLTLSGTRCRINVFQSVRGICFAIRLLSSFQNNLRDCNLHPDLRRLIEPKSGLVIVSGATGSGKSTTLAALIEEINASQAKHVIAVESPIEYFYPNRRSFIRQREVPTHTPSFEQAIVDSMRENPDVMVVGEMRTPDVMRLTLNAAETGHLVLTTMHSSSCAEAIARLSMSFPAAIQSSIRAQIADCLVAVVCQRLVYLPQAGMRVPQCEILIANSAAKTHIRSGQLSQIASSLQMGGEEGMWTFERYQRWLEQKRDWIKPAQAQPVATEERARREVRLPASAVAAPRFAQKPVAKSSDDGRIEIAMAEDDLEALARKISESETPRKKS